MSGGERGVIGLALNLNDPIEYDGHALDRMAERGVSRSQVEEALKNYGASYLAEARPGRAIRSMVYTGPAGGRTLKVYVADGSNPVYVLSVAWPDEEE